MVVAYAKNHKAFPSIYVINSPDGQLRTNWQNIITEQYVIDTCQCGYFLALTSYFV